MYARIVPATSTGAPTGREVIEAWKSIPHLAETEAEAFESDLENARMSLNQAPASQWE